MGNEQAATGRNRDDELEILDGVSSAEEKGAIQALDVPR